MRWLVVLALALPAAPAAGSPAEVFGLGSRAAGAGGAAAAWIDDFSAGYYNPAGLAFAPLHKTLTLGVAASRSLLEIDDRRYDYGDAPGVILGATGPVPLGGPLAGKLRVGLAIYAQTENLVRVRARLPDEPFFPWYDNRTQRILVLPFAGIRLGETLGVGLGLNVLAGLGGNVIAVQGPTRALEPRVDEEIDPRLAAHLGIRWQPSPAHALALVFRQSFGVPFSTNADTEVAGEPLAVDLSAVGLYTPDELVLGYAFHAGALVAAADVTWSRWSGYDGPFVRVTSDLPLVGALGGSTPDVPFSDTIALRAGLEAPAGRLFVRGGYGFETSPVPAEQRGVTNLLDGNKHTFSLGFGLQLGRARVDVHGQAQLVGRRTLKKEIAAEGQEPAPFDALRDEVIDDPNEPATLGAQISNPGYPFIDGGGAVISGGLTIEVPL